MANIKQKLLTDKEAKAAKKSVAVGGVPGLTLVVRDLNGRTSKTFVLRVQTNGKSKKYSIGTYGLYNIAQAREIAKDWLIKIRAGTDLKEEIRAKLAEQARPKYDITVEALLHEFLAFEESRGRWSTRGRQTHADLMEEHTFCRVLREVRGDEIGLSGSRVIQPLDVAVVGMLDLQTVCRYTSVTPQGRAFPQPSGMASVSRPRGQEIGSTVGIGQVRGPRCRSRGIITSPVTIRIPHEPRQHPSVVAGVFD